MWLVQFDFCSWWHLDSLESGRLPPQETARSWENRLAIVLSTYIPPVWPASPFQPAPASHWDLSFRSGSYLGKRKHCWNLGFAPKSPLPTSWVWQVLPHLRLSQSLSPRLNRFKAFWTPSRRKSVFCSDLFRIDGPIESNCDRLWHFSADDTCVLKSPQCRSLCAYRFYLSGSVLSSFDQALEREGRRLSYQHVSAPIVSPVST